jgi:hypothetical protein
MPDPVTEAIGWAVRALWRQPAAKKLALQASAMATGAAVRHTAEAAQDKITELELDGGLSRGAAKSLRGTVRVMDAGTSLTVSAVAGKAAGTMRQDGSVRGALRNAVQNPADTARAFAAGLANDSGTPDSKPFQNAWKSARRGARMHGLASKAEYLITGNTDSGQD